MLEKLPPKPGDSSEGNMNIQSAEGSVTMSYWPYGTRHSAAWVAYSNTLLSHSLFFCDVRKPRKDGEQSHFLPGGPAANRGPQTDNAE